MTEEIAVTPAESAPAELPELSSLTPEQRQEWRVTGELPKKADSAPAKEQAEPDSAPDKAVNASDSATDKGKQHRKTSEDSRRRWDELLEERKTDRQKMADMERELELLKKGRETKADPPPAKVEEPKHPGPRKAWLEQYFKDNKDKNYEDGLDAYDEAVNKFAENSRKSEIDRAISTYSQQQTALQASKKLAEEIQEMQKVYPDFDQKRLDDAAGQLMAPEVPQLVKLTISRSPVFTQLMYTLSGSDKFSEFLQQSKVDPIEAVKKIGKIEAEIEAELAKGGKKQTARSEDGKFAKTESEDKKPVASETKPAPRPPVEVGGRSSASEDEAVHAVQNGDFRSAKAKWTADYIAARR